MAVPDNDELFYDALGLLRNLISVPSLSRDESAAADIIWLFLHDSGLDPDRFGNNVWAVSAGFDGT